MVDNEAPIHTTVGTSTSFSMQAWEFDETQWTRRPTSTQPPIARWLAFDERRGLAVMFYPATGYVIELAGNNWLPSTIRTPFLYGGATATYCPWLGVTVIAHADTGAMTLGYDGFTIFRFFPYNGPQPRGGSASVADTDRKRLVDTGGIEGSVQHSLHVFEFDHQYPGSAVTFGSGCPGANGTPVHGMDGLPYLMSSVRLRLDSGPLGSQVSALALGVSNKTWGSLSLPLSLTNFGMAGCFLHTSIDLTIPLATLAGHSQIDVPIIGYNFNLVGRALYSQWFAIDATANVLGVVASNGLCSTVGSY